MTTVLEDFLHLSSFFVSAHPASPRSFLSFSTRKFSRDRPCSCALFLEEIRITSLHIRQVSFTCTMSISLIKSFVIAIFLLITNTYAVGIVYREACEGTYTVCSPPGATNSVVPPVGGALSGLFFDLVGSVNPQPVKRDIAADQTTDHHRNVPSTICCE